MFAPRRGLRPPPSPSLPQQHLCPPSPLDPGVGIWPGGAAGSRGGAGWRHRLRYGPGTGRPPPPPRSALGRGSCRPGGCARRQARHPPSCPSLGRGESSCLVRSISEAPGAPGSLQLSASCSGVCHSGGAGTPPWFGWVCSPGTCTGYPASRISGTGSPSFFPVALQCLLAACVLCQPGPPRGRGSWEPRGCPSRAGSCGGQGSGGQGLTGSSCASPEASTPLVPIQQPWVLSLCSRCLPPYGVSALLLVTRGGCVCVYVSNIMSAISFCY